MFLLKDNRTSSLLIISIIVGITIVITTTFIVFLVYVSLNYSALQFFNTRSGVPILWTQRNISYDSPLYGQYGKRGVISMPQNIRKSSMKLVCYYVLPTESSLPGKLYPPEVDANLCTHLIVGFGTVVNNKLVTNDFQKQMILKLLPLKKENINLKILLSVGGGNNDNGFSEMTKNHRNRKIFVQSLINFLRECSLDGIDLDWEFPEANSNKYFKMLYEQERLHFSQLLRDIRNEFIQEGNNTYLLTIAVAAPRTIVDVAYDIPQINKFVNFINIMTYDFHSYSRTTPFTGLNSPLYKQIDEFSLAATLNINYTANYWLNKGMDRDKIVIGLPIYGHSFTLVNSQNTRIGSPARGFGHLGGAGFTTYPDVCLFIAHNIYVNLVYDKNTCSPYLFSGLEWVSFDNEESLSCKADYIKSHNFGGAMIFSLNTDDFANVCPKINTSNLTFPLTRKVKSIIE